MGISNSLRDSTKALARQTAALKESMKALVKNLPPNPDVRRVSRTCCVVSSSILLAHDNWTPSYWTEGEMQERLCGIIDKTRPENLRRTIVQIVLRNTNRC